MSREVGLVGDISMNYKNFQKFLQKLLYFAFVGGMIWYVKWLQVIEL